MQPVIPQYEKVCDALRKYGVSYAGLFGSRVRKDHRKKSDYDILVDFFPKSKMTLLGMAELQIQLEELLGVPVDLVTKQSVSPYIRDRVFSQVIPFYEAKN
ncbi:MAG: hypothetical protein UV63_C0039G0004 [Microgenomates group bacterium GW2011_GWC1_43_11]|nr:MAG: hypothetical protein UV63_C0039G0004 [Microgenomates group bacterium GW2011_GWC1_43_11]KKT59911.1 MAG: putative nucleotidyltransferase [Candidatus Gottesmanbacteria bacterium GW2011_GWA1_44_24b]